MITLQVIDSWPISMPHFISLLYKISRDLLPSFSSPMCMTDGKGPFTNDVCQIFGILHLLLVCIKSNLPCLGEKLDNPLPPRCIRHLYKPPKGTRVKERESGREQGKKPISLSLCPLFYFFLFHLGTLFMFLVIRELQECNAALSDRHDQS